MAVREVSVWECEVDLEEMCTVDDTFCCFGRRLLALGEVVGVKRGEGGIARDKSHVITPPHPPSLASSLALKSLDPRLHAPPNAATLSPPLPSPVVLAFM
jgi:hypothetical protein